LSNRSKLIIGGILIVITTFLLTSFGYFLLLAQWSGDAVGVLQLVNVVHLIKNRYVDDVPTDTLYKGAIKGAVGALNDPHSIYMDAQIFKEFMIETEGSFGGVGIVLGVKDKMLTVVSPIEGTPGDKAGIKSGDQIVKINGLDTKDMALDEAVNKIRGPEGSQVTLSILRNQTVTDYTLTRSSIQIKTVTGKMLPNDIGYIRIAMFNENTGSDFIHKYQELQKAGMKAIILDLRDNPGGLLEESVKVAGLLVPKGPIVSVVPRNEARQTSYSNLDDVKYPLVVLVNGGSASAAEIVAGAVQDTGSGTLVGTKTYGKGSVQTLLKIGQGTAVKLTIAKYYTPNDRSINGVGLQPDVLLDMPEPKDPNNDIQLDKATAIIMEKLK
jgi:carboxyl-terminal processing protease